MLRLADLQTATEKSLLSAVFRVDKTGQYFLLNIATLLSFSLISMF